MKATYVALASFKLEGLPNKENLQNSQMISCLPHLYLSRPLFLFISIIL